jgi:Bacteriophage HK97-gp10, putative tail-component
MAGFRVTDPQAPMREVDPGVGEIAERFRGDVAGYTPVLTGALRAGWRVRRVGDGHYAVSNGVRYAGYVEYGTSKMAPRAMLGRALAGA